MGWSRDIPNLQYVGYIQSCPSANRSLFVCLLVLGSFELLFDESLSDRVGDARV